MGEEKLQLQKLSPDIFHEDSKLFDRAVLALQDGSVFYGYSIGHFSTSFGEVVFNTSMTGYQ